MRYLIALSVLTFLVQPAAQTPAPNPASPAPFDIYLLPITGGVGSMKTAKPVAVSTAPGYDNQPNFSADGQRILFAANRDGKQTDVFMFNRENGRVAQMTQTAESENSPTFVPNGAGPAGSFSVVQSEFDKNGNRPTPAIQRLWRFGIDPKAKTLILPNVDPVGYHAWIDSDTLVLFVLGAQGKPSTLQIASVKTGKAEVVAENVGRSLHRIPGTALASVVLREPSGEYWVKQLDVATKKLDPLVKAVDGSSDRDMAWLPDGTILMSSGTKIFSWKKGAASNTWTEVFDAAASGLGPVTRLAVSPKGDAVAFVVAELSKK